MRYRVQKRGGKGLRDIKTTNRNGKVIGTLAVEDGDDVLLMSAQGKIQRIRAADISTIGRNTQGVTIMKMDDEDQIVSIARIPAEVADDDEELSEDTEGTATVTPDETPTETRPADSDEQQTDGDSPAS